jgi:2-dehydropantoate 2-reductase
MGLEKPEIAIIGAGGMGALFGAILQKGGLSVRLVDTNEDHVAAIREVGLSISGFGGDRVERIEATTDAADIGRADVILFQCKAHGTRDGARAVRHLVEGGAVCISFQNGLGNEEVIAEELGSANVLGGLTTMAAQMLGPGSIRDYSRVPSYIGEMAGGDSGRVRQIAAAFTAAGLETHASSNITLDIWKKLLGNIAMSALSGATNKTSAACLAVPALKETSLRALDEALAVAGSLGIDLDRGEAVNGMEMISQAGGTGDNKSSLCVDILNQRPTEVDFIYGSVIARGRQTGVPTPTLDTLSSIVKGLESQYRDVP